MTSAVRHSAGMPRVGRVFVFWRGKNLPKIITETIHGGLPVTHVNDPALWPAASQCHLYGHAELCVRCGQDWPCEFSFDGAGG
jgi:hypothetical protein